MGETVGLTFTASTLSLFDARHGPRLPHRRQCGGPPWLRLFWTDCQRLTATTQALKNVSMTIPDGAFVVLLGPTGAGKTTTLRLIAGLDAPDAGDVRIDGALASWPTCPHSATWRWCSSNTRSTRT